MSAYISGYLYIHREFCHFLRVIKYHLQFSMNVDTGCFWLPRIGGDRGES